MTERKEITKRSMPIFTPSRLGGGKGRKEREHVGEGLIFYKKTTKLGSVKLSLSLVDTIDLSKLGI